MKAIAILLAATFIAGTSIVSLGSATTGPGGGETPGLVAVEWSHPVGAPLRNLDLSGDLNADGLADIALGGGTGCLGRAAVLSRTGSVLWARNDSSETRLVRVRDLQDDGAPEIVVTSASCASTVRTFNASGGTLWTGSLRTWVDDLIVADIHPSLGSEVVAGTWGQDRAWNATGSRLWDYNGTTHSGGPVQAADWNADGWPDVVIRTASNDGKLHIVSGTNGSLLGTFGSGASERDGRIVSVDGAQHVLTWTKAGSFSLYDSARRLVWNGTAPLTDHTSVRFVGSRVFAVDATGVASFEVADGSRVQHAFSPPVSTIRAFEAGEFVKSVPGREIAIVDGTGALTLYGMGEGSGQWRALAKRSGLVSEIGMEPVKTGILPDAPENLLLVGSTTLRAVRFHYETCSVQASLPAPALSEWHDAPVSVALASDCASTILAWLDGAAASVPVEVASEGVHRVEYQGIDANGVPGPVGGLPVKIDLFAPVVETPVVQGALLTAETPQPLGQRTLALGRVLLSAEATDSASGVARVEFLVDGVVIGVDEASPYEREWSPNASDAGLRSIEARAFDHAGRNSTSPAVRVVVLDPARV